MTADVTEPKKEEEIPVVDVPEALPVLWFSLYPRTPCDNQSLVNLGKDRSGSDAEEEGDGLM